MNVPISISEGAANVLVKATKLGRNGRYVSSRFETIEWRDAFALCQSGAYCSDRLCAGKMLKRGMRGLENSAAFRAVSARAGR